MIRQNVEKINGALDVIISSLDLSEIEDGFANYIQAYAPKATTIEEYYDGKTEMLQEDKVLSSMFICECKQIAQQKCEAKKR